MAKISVISHILPNIVHGGYEDPASLTLWLDEHKKTAHLAAHSGEPVPLNGPTAPRDAPTWEVNGKTGYIMIVDEAEIEDLRSRLEYIFEHFKIGDSNKIASAKLHQCLDEFDISQESYEDWTAENDPETHADLYQ